MDSHFVKSGGCSTTSTEEAESYLLQTKFPKGAPPLDQEIDLLSPTDVEGVCVTSQKVVNAFKKSKKCLFPGSERLNYKALTIINKAHPELSASSIAYSPKSGKSRKWCGSKKWVNTFPVLGSTVQFLY